MYTPRALAGATAAKPPPSGGGFAEKGGTSMWGYFENEVIGKDRAFAPRKRWHWTVVRPRAGEWKSLRTTVAPNRLPGARA